jgi:hypothetical protein
MPAADVRVLAVWEPVLWSDLAPPLSVVLSQIQDTRVSQYWDPHRALSEAIVRADKAGQVEFPCGEAIPADAPVWDFVAIYPPGVRWDASPPAPVYCGYPVLNEMDQVRSHLLGIMTYLW